VWYPLSSLHTVPQKKTSTLDLPSEGGDATLSDIEQCYDIGRVVGDGNFAVVRECRRRDSGQTLAMKIVERSKLIGREHMMQNELSLLGSLCHPRIVRLFAHHHTHTHSYLVMELVSGGDLFEAISESGKFSEAAAGLMVSDVSEALSYIHSKSIVHRDLKPENLLVAAGVCRLKLGDFGLAMVKASGTDFTVFLSAEFVVSLSGYGVEVDVWALGVILYILLCGFPPFRSRDRDQEELFQLIKQGQLHFPSPYWDSISEGEMCRCVFMMEHVNVKAVLKTTCVFVCRSQRPHQSFASARPHSEAGSRADPPAPLGESHGFSLQAEGAHRQKSEEHWRCCSTTGKTPVTSSNKLRRVTGKTKHQRDKHSSDQISTDRRIHSGSGERLWLYREMQDTQSRSQAVKRRLC
uniref:Doublecortin-like kinase 3 n=1 Tax=Salarias fasciatus TaxID=181472 RepID=A0A672HWT0_SALFA